MDVVLAEDSVMVVFLACAVLVIAVPNKRHSFLNNKMIGFAMQSAEE